MNLDTYNTPKTYDMKMPGDAAVGPATVVTNQALINTIEHDW